MEFDTLTSVARGIRRAGSSRYDLPDAHRDGLCTTVS
jgi:hypothetical protein